MRDSIGIYICKAQKCPLLGRSFLDSFASGGGGREKTLGDVGGQSIAVRCAAATNIILHKRYCCGPGPGRGRPCACGDSGGTPSSTFAVGEQACSPSLRRAARRTFTKSSAEIHLIPSSPIRIRLPDRRLPYCKRWPVHAPPPAAPLSLLLAASRQFILHDANQAFVLIYAAVHSSARAATRPLATKSPLSLAPRRPRCRHRHGRYSSSSSSCSGESLRQIFMAGFSRLTRTFSACSIGPQSRNDPSTGRGESVPRDTGLTHLMLNVLRNFMNGMPRYAPQN